MAAKKESVIPVLEAVSTLWRFGYFGDPETVELAEVLEKATASKIRAAVRTYQKFNGLKADGWVGPKTARLLNNPLRCGLPDMMAAGQCKWPMQRVTYHSRISLGLGAEVAAEAFDIAARQWNAVCGIGLVRVNTTRCNILADEGSGQRDQMDQRGGVLAWSTMPCGAGEGTRMQQKYDTAERWDKQMLVAVCCHEIGHAIGLPHIKQGNLLAPYYDPNITKPQAGDIAEVVKRYGKPMATPPSGGGSVGDSGDKPYVEITVTIGGVKYTAEGNTRVAASQAVRKSRKAGVVS